VKKEPQIPLPSRRLTEFRKALGLSQEQLAERVMPITTNQQIGRLERGVGKNGRELTYEWAERLALALGCKPEDFFKDDLKIEDIPRIVNSNVTPPAQTTGSTEEEPMKLGELVDILAQLPEESLSRIGRVAKGELLMIQGASANRPREGQS
jgi:transcriptional regulator with XRE-family HTH domain